MATSISMIHCNASMGFFAFEQTSVRKFENPVLKLHVIKEFSLMHLRGRITWFCHATLSTSPNTRSMVCHTHKTIFCRPGQMSLLSPESRLGRWIVTVLHFHFSQFFYSQILPWCYQILRNRVIHQDLVEQVGNQERFLKYSYLLV